VEEDQQQILLVEVLDELVEVLDAQLQTFRNLV
jgi:hypothetical protein